MGHSFSMVLSRVWLFTAPLFYHCNDALKGRNVFCPVRFLMKATCFAGPQGRSAFTVLKRVTLCNLFFSKRLSWCLLLNTVSKTTCLWSPVTTFIKYKETEGTQILCYLFTHISLANWLFWWTSNALGRQAIWATNNISFSSAQPIMTTSLSLFISSSFTLSVVIKVLFFSCTWGCPSYQRYAQGAELPPKHCT